MLSMASIGSASSAGSYYANDNYYTADDQLGQSEWGGEAAAALGLSGPVDCGAFEQILSGHLPNGKVLTGGAKEHAPGFDLTFSAPKSVSLMALVGGDARLVRAHHESVQTAMAWVESHLSEARMGKDGQIVVATGKLAYALFTHDVSRELDPQLHTHSVIANVTQRPDGAWRALHNGKIWNANMLIGAIYHNELRHAVQDLGYSIIGGGKNGTFEIAGIDRQTVEAWSVRNQQIREIADKLNITSPEGRHAIAERSREAKHVADPASVRQAWQALAAERGTDFHALIPARHELVPERGVLSKIRAWGEALLARVTPYFRPAREPLIADADQINRAAPLGAGYAVAASVRHLHEREATFSEHQLLQHALSFAEQKARIGDVEARVAHLKAEGALLIGKGEQQTQLTTPDMVRLEKQIIARARDGIGKATARVPVERAVALIDKAANDTLGHPLNPEQRQAASAILASTDRFVTIQGGAGTGKSTVFAAVNTVDTKARDALLILTPQNKLAAELNASSGIEARSLAGFLMRHERLASGPTQASLADRQQFGRTTIILDEASMVSTRQMLGLMQIADKLGANRLVLVGDVGQIAAVEAGSPFRQLQENALNPVRLSENLRQRGDDMKLAVTKLQAGLVREAFDKLGNKVIEKVDPVSVAAEAWLKLDDKSRDQTALFTSGHHLRELLLDKVRTALIAEGKLGASEIKLPTLESLNMTREQMRSAQNYTPGLVLDVHRNTPAIGLERGAYTVAAVDGKTREVTVTTKTGEHRFRPDNLHPNANGLSLSRPSDIIVRTGDTLQWNANDRALGVTNGQTVKLARVDGQAMTLTDQAGKTFTLDADDPMRQRLGHGLVQNMHRVQGLTVDNAITVMSSNDRSLNTQSLAYVLASRAREGFALYVDDCEKVINQVEANSGLMVTALDLFKDRGAGSGAAQALHASELKKGSEAKTPEAELKIPYPEKYLGLSL